MTQVRSLGWEFPLEESMATHSSICAWRIQWTEEPGGLQSVGWQKVSWTRLKRLSMHISGEKVKRNKKGYKRKWGFLGGASGKEPTCKCRRHKRHGFDPWIRKIPWRRAWQPTPVLLPGESHGQRNLAGYRPWSCKKSDTTEAT